MTKEFCIFTAIEKWSFFYSGTLFVVLPIFETTSNVDDERRPERHRRRRRRLGLRSRERRLAESVGDLRDGRTRGRTPSTSS